MRSAQTVLQVDAVAEAVIAVCCLLLAARVAGTATWNLPSWLGPSLLVAAAAVLVVAAAVLWWLARRADPAALRAVAIANAVTAVLVVVWAVLGLADHGPLRSAVVVVAAVLGVLATAQLGIARRVRTTTPR